MNGDGYIFYPPASLVTARTRKVDLANETVRLQTWLSSHPKQHPDRPGVLRDLKHLDREKRDLRLWLAEHNAEEQAVNKPVYIIEESVKRLIAGLHATLDRLVDEGAKLTDEEHDHLDHGAAWLARNEKLVARVARRDDAGEGVHP